VSITTIIIIYLLIGSPKQIARYGVSHPPKQPASFVPPAHTPLTQPRSFNIASPGSALTASPSAQPQLQSQPPLIRPSNGLLSPPSKWTSSFTSRKSPSGFPLGRPLAEDRRPIVNIWTVIAIGVGLVTLVLKEEGQVVVGDGDCERDLRFFLRICCISGSIIPF